MKAVNAVSTPWPGFVSSRPSFTSVAEAELDAVHRYLLFVTGDPSVAEDLTGATFEKAFRVWRRFDPRRGSARAWLCRIARGVALDHFRAEERRRRREARYARDVTGVCVHEGLLSENQAKLERKYDAVVSWDVLEHVRDPLRFLRECVKRLTLKRLEEMMSDARD